MGLLINFPAAILNFRRIPLPPAFNISQVDLGVDEKELELLSSCIQRRWLSEGPLAQQFTNELRHTLGAKHVVLAPNATLGILLALYALELPPGSEILVPSFTFYGSVTPIIFAGHKPVFVDVDPHTFNATADDFAKAITPDTSAILPVHLYGQACGMAEIMALADKHGLKVLEDAAQAFGVKFNGKQAGTFGDIGVISFFSDKVITTGEGGALLTNSDAMYEKLRLLRNQGRPNAGTFIHPSLGMNFRMTDLQAGIGLVQMKKFATIHEERLRKWKLYAQALTGVGDLRPMQVHEQSNLVPFRFPMLSKKRDGAMAAMEKAGIQTRGFFYPMHLQPKLRATPPQSLPVSERLSEEGICLPVHPHLSDADINAITGTLRAYYQSGA